MDDCHNRALSCAFRSDPDKFHAHAKSEIPISIILRQGAVYRQQLQHELQSSPAHTLVLSAEDLSWFSPADIRTLVDFLTTSGLRVRALAFVRRFKRDLESRFQQSVREPGWRDLSKPRCPGFFPIGYQRAASSFDSCPGRSDVLLYEFEPQKFDRGCVVLKFCQEVGIRQNEIPRTFANDSLSADAVNLLYAYRMYSPGYGKGWAAMGANSRLVEKLSELQGPRLLFHSSLLTSKEDKWRPDVEWAMQRTGFDLLGDIYEDDDKQCVRSQDDMLRFSPTSLDWLACAASIKATKIATGDPKAVAGAVRVLSERLTRLAKLQSIRNGVSLFLPSFLRR